MIYIQCSCEVMELKHIYKNLKMFLELCIHLMDLEHIIFPTDMLKINTSWF